jgi:hypothetical protein
LLLTGQYALAGGIAPFLLQIIFAGADDLIILAIAGAAKSGAEIPGALVAVFVTAPLMI